MRKTLCASALGLALFSFGPQALAQANVHNADVLQPGSNMVYGQVGWPDFTAGFQHGVSNVVDVGVALSIIYGPEYRTQDGTEPGLGLRAPIRITPVRTERVSFQIRFEPGIKFDSFGHSNSVCANTPAGVQCANVGVSTPVEFGFWFYFGMDVGIHITREATLTIGMEAPFYMNVTNSVYGGVPLLFGPGFEYDIDQHIGVGIKLNFGPSIIAASGGSETEFGLIAQPFFGYKF